MPFQSEKQRKYLWANEPEIAREWTDKYGSRVKKQWGGIMDYLMPAWNFSKGIYGDQNPTITSSMQQDLINRAQATGLDTGSLGYSDFGAESLGSGRFGGGIKSLAQEGGSPFANALSLGRVSFNRDPNAPGGYTFGDTKYDFNVDDTPTGTGLRGYLNPENILRGSQAALAAGCEVVTFSGFKGNNPLRLMGDYNFYANSSSYGFVEIAHLSICHCICDLIIQKKSKS